MTALIRNTFLSNSSIPGIKHDLNSCATFKLQTCCTTVILCLLTLFFMSQLSKSMTTQFKLISTQKTNFHATLSYQVTCKLVFPAITQTPLLKSPKIFHVQGFRGCPPPPLSQLDEEYGRSVGRFERTLCDLFHDRGYDTIA